MSASFKIYTDESLIDVDEEDFVPLALHQYSNDANLDTRKTEIKKVDYLSAESGICCQSVMDTCKAPLKDIACEKGTNHSNVKDLNSLSVLDLPSSYQNDDMISLIKSAADLAVLIQVPWAKTALFCQGTGKVDDVYIFKENTKCRCCKCRASEHPSATWGKVLIATSTNLLTASSKVSDIKCTFFYDNDETMHHVKHLQGDAYVSNMQGVCKFFAYTCDVELLEKLESYLDIFSEKWIVAYDKYSTTVKSVEDRLLIMVSHPHSCKKHVYIGKWTKLRPYVQFDATTCPGCEGSFLLIPNFDIFDEDFS
ncbi:uncharacterized protein LOC106072184 isoform X3 [Biomphalaria glabrata]|uniref:Uncharacterized protein LOC106072184 isoform X1 n=1 Tax=Biomphalaria glabrata TaxID=6526 RepID=A0A9W2YXT0_BIOGL|nr:uncharacterized protein LOC106072184 isoform X1 [Biomphalaria glabrata]XP_055867577.1 uncharacterized protein LOC106072184 isoform X2 [Biomphalaria glabrata]XP_055867578.1 uncharacterized protein LOC106072184 isoform X3 [Biomphalaria glabrata]